MNNKNKYQLKNQFLLAFKRSVFVFFMLLPFSSKAQDYLSDIKEINKAYYGLEDFSVSIESRIYETKQSKVPDKKVFSKVMKLGSGYKTITDIVETIYTPKYVIAISKMGKTMMYAPNDKKVPNPLDAFPMIDSMVNKLDSVVYVGEHTGEKHYKLYMRKQAIMMVDVYFRAADFIFTRIDYTYNSSESGWYKVETLFNNINKSAGLTRTEFSSEYYIVDKDPLKIKATDKYKGYQVIYNDFSKRNKKH